MQANPHAGIHQLVQRIRETGGVEELPPNRVAALDTKSYTLIDVRESSEWDTGHLPDAIHLSKGLLEVKIERLVPDKNEQVILYCAGGTRSLIAAHNLRMMGYQNLISLSGGINAWVQAGYMLS